MATVTVETSNYQFTHGKQPRGQGTWFFGAKKNTPVEHCFIVNNASFSQAKTQAKKWAKTQGFFTVHTQT